MSVHPSLTSKGKGKRVRSVLKRFERLKQLLEKDKWQVGKSIFGLPKIKILRWKAKKGKKAAEVETATGEGAPETAAETKASTEKKETSAKK